MSARLAHALLDGAQMAELEEVLAGYYAAAMKVTSELNEDATPDAVVLPPFEIRGYQPSVDLGEVEAVLTLAPGTAMCACGRQPNDVVRCNL